MRARKETVSIMVGVGDLNEPMNDGHVVQHHTGNTVLVHLRKKPLADT